MLKSYSDLNPTLTLDLNLNPTLTKPGLNTDTTAVCFGIGDGEPTKRQIASLDPEAGLSRLVGKQPIYLPSFQPIRTYGLVSREPRATEGKRGVVNTPLKP